MKYYIKLAFIFAFCVLNAQCQSTNDTAKKSAVNKEKSKPNFIVIYTDDHGYSDLSIQGIKYDVKTPNIDNLARNGVRMESGYSTAPQCVPSRGGILTGRFQSRFGLELNGDSLEGFDAETTIADRLKSAGYATGMAGKWHLGPGNQITKHGFDHVFYKNSAQPGVANFNFEGKSIPLAAGTTKMYHLDACSKAATTFIEMHKDKPFFFYLAYRAPHVPLDATQKYLDRFPGKMPERRRQALAMLSAVDDGVGEIMKTLDENNLTDNTVIFIIGDNGAPLKITKKDKPGGGPGWDGSLNDPLNGEKGTLIEGGIRTPFVVYWKDKLVKGTYKHPVSSMDFAATAVELAGLSTDDKLDGVNLIPFLNGEKLEAPHDKLCWRWGGQSAIRKGEWKFFKGDDREYLFNLDQDIEEKNDLLAKHPEIVKELKKELLAWSNGLTPTGFSKGGMSKNANAYFDYYLDGITNKKVSVKTETGKNKKKNNKKKRN
ncbi:sulfatase [Algibacter miyuki]|uniref:Sulfatase n=1 Tax=Algibacter miyuki TaxID=1306933 RepID=A0ABV5H4G6_9FLAO|nr:sulfatase-like hydrolase/transferase [Algibacter miyuki]MDN3664015.1 sulfatase-like hydrolase/transferase [Algibacter miyuki]